MIVESHLTKYKSATSTNEYQKEKATISMMVLSFLLFRGNAEVHDKTKDYVPSIPCSRKRCIAWPARSFCHRMVLRYTNMRVLLSKLNILILQKYRKKVLKSMRIFYFAFIYLENFTTSSFKDCWQKSINRILSDL